MNSSLQCLSNIPEFVKYFCFDIYKRDINKQNPLGTGGRVAVAFGGLLDELWIDNRLYLAPWDIKKAIARRAN
jgi:ubiquitin C-terminal hydrolase